MPWRRWSARHARRPTTRAARLGKYCGDTRTLCRALWTNLFLECGATRLKWRAIFGKVAHLDDLKQSWLLPSPPPFAPTWRNHLQRLRVAMRTTYLFDRT